MSNPPRFPSLRCSAAALLAGLALAFGTAHATPARAGGWSPVDPCCDSCGYGSAVCDCAAPASCAAPVTCAAPAVRPVVETDCVTEQCVTWRDVCETTYRRVPRCETVAVNRPRLVTVDEGCWQRVWVPRKVTRAVPCVEYETRRTWETVPCTVRRRVPRRTTRVVPVRRVRYVPCEAGAVFTPPCDCCPPPADCLSPILRGLACRVRAAAAFARDACILNRLACPPADPCGTACHGDACYGGACCESARPPVIGAGYATAGVAGPGAGDGWTVDAGYGGWVPVDGSFDSAAPYPMSQDPTVPHPAPYRTVPSPTAPFSGDAFTPYQSPAAAPPASGFDPAPYYGSPVEGGTNFRGPVPEPGTLGDPVPVPMDADDLPNDFSNDSARRPIGLPTLTGRLDRPEGAAAKVVPSRVTW